MTLKEFIANINKFVEENPDSLELTVVASKDDEGNGFSKVICEPESGHYYNHQFISKENIDEGYYNGEINAVCIN